MSSREKAKSKSKVRSVLHKIRRAVWPGGGDRKGYRFHNDKLKDRFSGMRATTAWHDVILAADLRPGDHVLDMGCAEGEVPFEVAKHVAHVTGVEIEPARVEMAKSIARENGVRNVTFAVGTASDYPLEPESFDVVLFLHVMGKKTSTGHVGLAELARLLKATRRQIIVRLGIQKKTMFDRGITLQSIYKTMDECGFDGICFARQEAWYGHLIIGHRRGAGARIAKAPPFVLVPTDQMMDHPCLKGTTVAAYDEFS
jgi:SAM-dependent methyltransferase